MNTTNAEVMICQLAMQALCSAPDPTTGQKPIWRNRLPVLTSIEASRILTALTELWTPCEEWQNTYIADHGEEQEDGKPKRLASTSEHWADFQEKMQEMLDAEVELDITPLKLEEVEKGFARNSETGERGELDIDPSELGALVSVGIIEDPNQKDSEEEPSEQEDPEGKDEEDDSPAP